MSMSDLLRAGTPTDWLIFGSLRVLAENGPLHKGGGRSVFHEGIYRFLSSPESWGLLKECLHGVPTQLSTSVPFPDSSAGEGKWAGVHRVGKVTSASGKCCFLHLHQPWEWHEECEEGRRCSLSPLIDRDSSRDAGTLSPWLVRGIDEWRTTHSSFSSHCLSGRLRL